MNAQAQKQPAVIPERLMLVLLAPVVSVTARSCSHQTPNFRRSPAETAPP